MNEYTQFRDLYYTSWRRSALLDSTHNLHISYRAIGT